MNQRDYRNYQRVACAITYMREHFTEQPCLTDISRSANLSPFHFQRLFNDWAGVSPKKFMQYLSVEYAKQLLVENRSTLLDTAHKTGLSGTGRLHDLFVSIEGMTPGEYKNGGQNLVINYSFAKTLFGKLIVASTAKGICHMAFDEDEKQALTTLRQGFPNAKYHHTMDELQRGALFVFQQRHTQLEHIKLHLKATPFQLKVWGSLLRIPTGGLSSYGAVAIDIDNPRANRAVGTAIGKNPIAFIIPCHRVIKATGDIGDYRWGSARKSTILGWEAAKAGCR